jgi:uncharacterized membrane protein (UPF0127 family)
MKKFLTLISFVFLTVGCASTEDVPLTDLPPNHVINLVNPAGSRQSLKVWIARTQEEQARGLMGVESLAPATGMLFVFQEPQVLNFWMKNTLLPLDILFFDADNSFVSSRTMEPCTADPCPSYSSGKPAVSALEVPKGFVKTYGVGEGWRFE